MRSISALVLYLAVAHFLLSCSASNTSAPSFWPQPASWSSGTGVISLAASFTITCGKESAHCSTILENAILKARRQVIGIDASALWRTGVPYQDLARAGASLSLCTVTVGSDDESLGPGTDESYSLRIDEEGACELSAPTTFGALRGLVTLTQAVEGPLGHRVALGIPLQVDDAPRFTHRGLLVDSARHFLPMGLLLSTVDTMAATKLNVLHWHLTDAESFPLRTEAFPQLAEAGAWAPQATYSPADVRRLVGYARGHGIRVVPEFDIPGHGSWGRAFPHLMACDDTLDPTNDATFEFLSAFLGEARGLFLDEYIFLGGDEVELSCFEKNPRVAAWLAQRGWTADMLPAHFWSRVFSEVTPALNATVGVWESDEMQIDLDSLPRGASFVNLWQRAVGVAKATSAGVPAVFSGSYYLDQENPGGCKTYAWQQTWRCFYEADPVPPEAVPELVLGGETAMWGEGVNALNFESRVWTRAAAAAERFWSPREVRDVADAARRLSDHACRLNLRGVAASPVLPGFCPVDVVGPREAAGAEAEGSQGRDSGGEEEQQQTRSRAAGAQIATGASGAGVGAEAAAAAGAAPAPSSTGAPLLRAGTAEEGSSLLPASGLLRPGDYVAADTAAGGGGWATSPRRPGDVSASF